MDLLLLFVLPGVALGASVSTPGRWACGAREARPGAVALSALWFVFPARSGRKRHVRAFTAAGDSFREWMSAYRRDAADESRNRGVVVLFLVPRRVVAALRRYMHTGDTSSSCAVTTCAAMSSTIISRSRPARAAASASTPCQLQSVLGVDDAVGLPARPPLQTCCASRRPTTA